MLASFALGVLLGAGSSVVPGPCGLAVMDAARHRGRRRAVATAAGAALGDGLYATLGVVGGGRLLARHPAIPSVLLAISGALLIGLGTMHLRRNLCATPPAPAAARDAVIGGVGVGLATLLANPGALITWVVIVGAELHGASPEAQWSAVVGVAAGSFAWFTGVAHLAARGTQTALPTLQRITTLASGMLVAYGVVSLARAAL